MRQEEDEEEKEWCWKIDWRDDEKTDDSDEGAGG